MDKKDMILFPPKPNAIATLLTTEGSALISPITHIETFVFSIHKSLQKYQSAKYRKENSFYYLPEILIVVAVGNKYEEEIVRTIRKALAVFSVRIIKVKPIYKSITRSIVNQNESPRKNQNFSALHLFNQESYNSILHINQNCLVTQDISNVFELKEKNSHEIIAAAFHHTESNKFGSAFMLLRPSYSCFQDMMEVMNDYIDKGDDLDSNSDQLCEDFLNYYFAMSLDRKQTSIAKKFVMESDDIYDAKGPNNYISNDIIHIYHFSFTPKPWEENAKKNVVNSKACNLWDSFYKNGQSYIEERRQRQKDKLEAKQKKKMNNQKLTKTSAAKVNDSKTNMNTANHKSIAAKYKILRKQGLSAKDAMVQARAAIGDVENGDNPGASVAAMFGLK